MNKFLDPSDEYDIIDREQQKEDASLEIAYQKLLETRMNDPELIREAINEQSDSFMFVLAADNNELARRIKEYIEQRAMEI